MNDYKQMNDNKRLTELINMKRYDYVLENDICDIAVVGTRIAHTDRQVKEAVRYVLDGNGLDYNKAAFEACCNVKWITLPRPISFITVSHRRGSLPQSRIATITYVIDGKDYKANGFGNVQFDNESESRVAVNDAVKKLIEQLSVEIVPVH